MESPVKHTTITTTTTTNAAAMWKITVVASIAAGIQFGWALQLSLLTPYTQELGVPHALSSLIWLCGPISGFLVQPLVGYYSDRSQSRFGRRRPFIISGALAVALAVFLIGFAADLGHSLGDDLSRKLRPRSVAIFVVGFWILDVANNMLQGPCRAFLGDLAAGDHKKTRIANALFSFFMAVGSVLGYAAGSMNGIHKMLPFTETRACDVFCANLKTCFFISIFLLLLLTALALFFVPDERHVAPRRGNDEVEDAAASIPCLGEITGALKEVKKPMLLLMAVTAINWIAWFPFILYDTDWMGKEVYGGKDNARVYDKGVHAGSLGLMFNAVVLGVMSLGVEPIGRAVGGVKNLWGMVNFLLAVGMLMMVVITKVAQHERHVAGGYVPPSEGVRVGALLLFAVLGIPLSITFSVPFALASIYSSSSGAGQGLSLGVLNLSIVIPQMIVAALSGPWDALFGGGNLPAFVVGAVAAVVSGVMAIFLLPAPKPSDAAETPRVAGGFH